MSNAACCKDVDGRDKPGHDLRGSEAPQPECRSLGDGKRFTTAAAGSSAEQTTRYARRFTMTITNPRSAVVAALAFTLLATFAAAAGDAPPEPDSYRQNDYRATTPASLKGARVLTTDEARAMWRAGDAAFIDVLPQAPRPKNLPADVVWRDKPRSDIPGSLWLPDTGYGELAPLMLDYFRRGLDKALGGRPRPLVFYCLKDCWMSWNAAKRALALGYGNVAWYPEGSDGWAAAGLPVEKRAPEPRP
jgi:PQQ-dependent catabolism-associated CXXCW motif protein